MSSTSTEVHDAGTAGTAETAGTAGTARTDRRSTGGGRFDRIARSPLAWAVTGFVGVTLVAGATATAPGPLPAVGAALALGVYRVVMRRQARRATPEIARRGAVREWLLGAGIGLGFLLSSILLITLFGGFSFSWAGNGASVVVSAVITIAGGALTEELTFRGLALQALEQRWGGRAAVALTSLFFGFAHFFNPGATVWSALAIALEAGVLLGVAFLWRRNLWFVFGLHFAWNLVQQLFGIAVSGHVVQGLLVTHAHGPAWLTGGVFGLEASVVPVLISFGLSVGMLTMARKGTGLAPVAAAAH
ncbi:CPBP family intramembrane glutamic endopeptidase [Kitasatospora sp. NPDC096140]|uniref:CPBP family intramembrane glutamic endopeptidase n=1 Tax=Kitasatospora sp. NPDC096140 TaxID=3155425 RepID=UPI00332DB90B